MPVLTQAQSYAVQLLQKLLRVRRDQMHWMIGRKFPDLDPEKLMRQVRHITMIRDDGEYYSFSGVSTPPDRTVAVDIMLRICGGSLPIFDVARYPCALVFFLMRADRVQPFLVYTPKEGTEAECRAIAESQREPQGHAAVFYIQAKEQIPLLKISRPHIFAVSDGNGGFDFLDARL